MRIALAADGTRGDIHPMLALARGLARRGHQVLLCAPPNFADDAASRGVDFHPVGRDVRAYLESRAAMLHGGVLAALGEGQRYIQEQVGIQMRELVRAVGQADWILGAGSQFAASSVAERLGAHYRMVAYCPSLLRAPDQTPFLVPRGALPRWANRAAWWGAEWLVKRGIGRAIADARASIGLPPARDIHRLLFGERPALAAEAILAPLAGDLESRVVRIGCLHPFESGPLPPKLEAFLDAGDPPVYVGFGSMPDPDPQAATRLVLRALEAAGVRAVLSSGWAGLGSGALPEGVMQVGPVRHASLFPRMLAVIHHGGAGTTTTAARAGVPQILVPHVADQFHWAHRVERLGLGPPAIARRRLSELRLATAIGALRDNEQVALRAAELGERLRAELATRSDPAEQVLS